MNQDGRSRFMSVELVSSDDAGSEDGEIDDDVMSEGEGPRKRVKADITGPTEQAAPKWSNPEYFTALPPPESGLAPKKDIVQVIRKAKVESMPTQDTATNAVKENADFISFNMDDDDMMASEEDALIEPSPPKNAPTGPSKPGKEASGKPNDDHVPKKRRNQFVSPRGPPRPFSLRQINKSKDSTGPPPLPPPTIDQLMTMADRMGSKTKPPPDPVQQPKGKKRKAAEISKGLGDVVSEWRSNETNPTPWCTVDHTRTASVGLR
jgi:non-canonical poly(A) RNA polymerase PAPD5/7